MMAFCCACIVARLCLNSADLTIMEEGTELLRRLRKAWGLDLPAGASSSSSDASTSSSHAHHDDPGPLPMFTSCEWMGGN
jgi:hypothetical protein